jgi:hypothetical protein
MGTEGETAVAVAVHRLSMYLRFLFVQRYWQKRLQALVSEWIGGVELEMTDIYGMRRYEDGARLLTHVDRTSTHATSLIINIDQGVMREPWHVSHSLLCATKRVPH